jgi:pimeloyl-ACP methyl ester carboxylesterase
MPFAGNGPVRIYFETFGHRARPPLLLVSGLGDQCIGWFDDLCDRLGAAGFFVIRFDNRDTGLSSHLDDIEPDLAGVLAAIARGDEPKAPYSLSDMADDAIAVLDALDIERAHVLGASLGGFVAQRIAIDHPARVLSLTSMMSTTGEPDVGMPEPAALERLMLPEPTDREGWVAHQIDGFAVCGSPGVLDEERERDIAYRKYDRSFDPAGRERQMMAAIADGSRAEELRGLRVPTLVLHGADDTLITPAGGERTAELIPGARLVIVPGWGHDLAEAYWDAWISELAALRAAAC